MGGGYARRGVAAGIECVGEECGLPEHSPLSRVNMAEKKSMDELQLIGCEWTRPRGVAEKIGVHIVHVREEAGGVSLWI